MGSPPALQPQVTHGAGAVPSNKHTLYVTFLTDSPTLWRNETLSASFINSSQQNNQSFVWAHNGSTPVGNVRVPFLGETLIGRGDLALFQLIQIDRLHSLGPKPNLT